MSLDIWPPVSPEELRVKEAEAQERELAWIIDRTMTVCRELKHGLEDCYALLAPIDPGSTLVMSTPRNEKVKGTITRVGTRIVKASLSLQLRMIAPQTLTLGDSYPIHVHALDALHTHLTESIDILGLLLSGNDSSSAASNPEPDAQSLSSALRLLADSISSSAALLKGSPLTAPPDVSWLTESCPPAHFSPLLPPNFSFHVSLQECCVVLYLRILEPVDAPVRLGTKLGLAIGTYRRLEHDEMDMVFKYKPSGDDRSDARNSRANPYYEPRSVGRTPVPYTLKESEDVYVREKVRVESADPSLISLYSKLGYLSNMLNQARWNLAAVMGAEPES